MPTFNQLIHNGRSVAEKKSKRLPCSRAGTPRSVSLLTRIPPRSAVSAQR